MLKTYQVEREKTKKLYLREEEDTTTAVITPDGWETGGFVFQEETHKQTNTHTHTLEMPPKRYYRRRDGDGGGSRISRYSLRSDHARTSSS